MTAHLWALLIAAFLASTVEFVEAFTIVLAVGVTINWRSALTGAAAAVVVLAAIVGIFGTAIVRYVPLDDL
ncbi:MAG: COG4280 domain-containing protein, partial [Ktedonobacterales bacterium]